MARLHRQGRPLLHPPPGPLGACSSASRSPRLAADLRPTEGGDILVLPCAIVIKALLAADEVDRLAALTIFPGTLGVGPLLFDDGLPQGGWTLASQAAGEHGTPALVYDRFR